MMTWTMPLATATAMITRENPKKDECLYAVEANGINALYLVSALRKVKNNTVDENEPAKREQSERINVDGRDVMFTMKELESGSYSLLAQFV